MEESMYLITMNDGSVIEHHGVKGMKWGIRRSLQVLAAGRDAVKLEKQRRKIQNNQNKWDAKYGRQNIEKGSKLSSKATEEKRKIDDASKN